jgi:hypothetical protein
MTHPKYREVKVLVEETYFIPMMDETRSEINGWTLPYLVNDWFNRFDINSYHATRDTYRLGNGRKVISTEIVEP